MAPKAPVPDGPYNPDQYADAATGSSSSSSGPVDIWGLGTKATSPVYLGLTTPVGPASPYGGLGTQGGPYAPGREPLTPGSPAAARAAEERSMHPAGEARFISATEAMQQLPRLYAADKAGYAALQQKLFRAGFYGSTPPQRWGAYDPATVSAYRAAVLAAVQLADSKTPTTFEELLDQDGTGAGPKREGFVAQYSDPKAVAGLAQRAAQNAWGRNMTSEEVARFVAEFHSAEQAWNASSKAAALTAAGGTDAALTQAPSAEAAAEAYVHAGAGGVEAAGNNLADYVGVLTRMVESGQP